MDKTGGGVSRFSVKFFLSHSAEKHRRGTLPCCCFSIFMVAKKFKDKTGGTIKISFGKFFLSVPKEAVGEPLSLSSISGIEKICASEGYVTIFRRKFFVSQYRNIL